MFLSINSGSLQYKYIKKMPLLTSKKVIVVISQTFTGNLKIRHVDGGLRRLRHVLLGINYAIDIVNSLGHYYRSVLV